MGIDRFVNWKKKAPSLENVKAVLRDYLGSGATVMSDGKRITAVLQGKPSYPFRSMAGFKQYAAASEQHAERWFEVFVTKKNIDVITRQTDEYTNVIAEGFAALVARFWEGEREE